MKNRMLLIFILFLFISAVSPVSADYVQENPSFYSFAEVVQKLPEMWLANPADVMKTMDGYPDYICWRSYDIIGCRSVNNKYSAEINVNFQFSSEEDNAELTRTFFTMMINTPEDVQKVIEAFWLPNMKAANIFGGTYREDEITLYFSSEETLMKVSFPWSKDGTVWMIMVDMGLIRG